MIKTIINNVRGSLKNIFSSNINLGKIETPQGSSVRLFAQATGQKIANAGVDPDDYDPTKLQLTELFLVKSDGNPYADPLTAEAEDSIAQTMLNKDLRIVSFGKIRQEGGSAHSLQCRVL